jgi:hypothetical protein
MRSHFRVVIGSVVAISILMVLVFLLEGSFHLGGESLLQVARYCVLLGPLIASVLSLISVNIPLRQKENAEPWLRHERLAWILIGCGYIAWAIGEAFWRYYVAIGESPFPSLADIGFSTFFPPIFAGLILLPSSKSSQKRVFLMLDSLIVMGAMLSIAWFFLLGPLAQNPAQSPLGKFLGLYYPITDVALLSCLVFLLLRGSDGTDRTPARRISLLMLGLGLALYSIGDFAFNVLQNLGVYVEGTWTDLCWPLGMMIMAIGAYLRRFLPRGTSESIVEKGMEDSAERHRFGPAQLLPYLLLVILLVVLGINVLSSDKTQQSTRPVLFVATLIVIVLVIIRQIMTMHDNDLLMSNQTKTLKKLEKVYHEVEDRKIELEKGVTHLKEIQTRLANGDVRARAQITNGDLWPLAVGLNLMADRMMRFEHDQKHAQKLAKAISDLSMALEGSKGYKIPPVLPASCLDIPELHRLLGVLGLKPPVATHLPDTPTAIPPFPHQFSPSPATPNNPFGPSQKAMSPSSRKSP